MGGDRDWEVERPVGGTSKLGTAGWASFILNDGSRVAQGGVHGPQSQVDVLGFFWHFQLNFRY